MKNGALTFAFLVVAGAAGGVAFVGCSSPAEPLVAPADTGVDTAPVDTGKAPADTNPPVETGPVSCAAPLDSSFKCQAPPAKAGQKVCTDEMLTEFATCFGSGDTKRCSAAQTKFAACNKCVLADWLYGDPARYIDTGACIAKIDPAEPCAKLFACNIDCQTAVCSECDPTTGSGKTATTSEQSDCMNAAVKKGGTAAVPKGACYDVAAAPLTAAACNTKANIAVCFVRTTDDVIKFYRGACRDGGDWSQADIDKTVMTDAGVDTGKADAVAD